MQQSKIESSVKIVMEERKPDPNDLNNKDIHDLLSVVLDAAMSGSDSYFDVYLHMVRMITKSPRGKHQTGTDWYSYLTEDPAVWAHRYLDDYLLERSKIPQGQTVNDQADSPEMKRVISAFGKFQLLAQLLHDIHNKAWKCNDE